MIVKLGKIHTPLSWLSTPVKILISRQKDRNNAVNVDAKESVQCVLAFIKLDLTSNMNVRKFKTSLI